MTDASIIEEARAFDSQIEERVANGHIPDIRNTKFCAYFYNNPWRRPEYAKMIFGEYLSFFLDNLSFGNQNILEIACGPGHMSLELARHGHSVTGLEISKSCIDVAKKTLGMFPKNKEFGSLDYLCEDIFSYEPEKKFDAVVFNQALHHFEDQNKILSKVHSLLNQKGRLLFVEPARDWIDVNDAAIIGLIRKLMEQTGCWFETVPDLNSNFLEEIVEEYKTARTKKESMQSPHDNDSSVEEMLNNMGIFFNKIAEKKGFSFSHRVIGGIRGETEVKEIEMARTLVEWDKMAVNMGVLKPGVAMYCGEKKDI